MLGGSTNAHFAPADETTVRLVERVAQVPWLRDEEVVEGEAAKQLLGISLSPSQTASSVSVADVAVVMEKPGVQTPSRKAEETKADHEEESTGVKVPENMPMQRRAPPAIPTIKLNGHKKLPPKAPPRRRTRLKVMAAPEDAHDVQESGILEHV
jgi:hypothetical protein